MLTDPDLQAEHDRDARLVVSQAHAMVAVAIVEQCGREYEAAVSELAAAYEQLQETKRNLEESVRTAWRCAAWVAGEMARGDDEHAELWRDIERDHAARLSVEQRRERDFASE